MIEPAQLDDFLHMRLPETHTRQMLMALTPDVITMPLLVTLLDAMRQLGEFIAPVSKAVLDCCGTGGSGVSHFNTSTASAFVLAAGGVPVVKFGNRGMSSPSGSFDFLEALGIASEQPLHRVSDILETCGLVFLYAPQCYPALGQFNALRRTLGVRTIFNFLGPLLNPLSPTFRVLGVSHPKMQTLIADYLMQHTQTQKAFVIRGEPTLDELSPHTTNLIYEVTPQAIQEKTFIPNPLIKAPSNQPLKPSDNVVIFERIISGEDTSSWAYHSVCLNAGAGFYTAGKAISIEAGAELAKDLLKTHDVEKTVSLCRRTYASFSK